MDFLPQTSSLRDELVTDTRRAVSTLAELASRHANDRALVYRAIILRRELGRMDGPPSPAQVEAGIRLVDDLVADHVGVTGRGDASRHSLVEAARQRALSVDVPRDVVLECVSVGTSYRRGAFTLKNVSCAVRYGEITGVVGRNGNGKTTLFRVLTGELDAKDGVLSFPAIDGSGGGNRVNWRIVREQVAYVPQDLPVWFGSLKSNLHFEATVHGVKGQDNEREVDFIVERLDLRDDLDKRWHELSGGFKLRFSLARALVWKPKLLILDEPLANLDFITQQVVLNDLRHLTDSLRYPLAVIISSQHVHEIEEVSDNVMLLNRGDMRFFGAVDDIGLTRRINRFELTGRVEQHDLELALRGLEYHSLYYSGVSFVLTTPTATEGRDVLSRLIEHGLPITYFRDVSRSVKSLVEDDGDA